MSIKNRFREAIKQIIAEGKHVSHKNEFGCVMLYLDVDMDKWSEMEDMISDDDLYDPSDDPSYGKETEPHITALFGLHANVSDSDIEGEISTIKKPEFNFSGISAFKNELFDVLKFDVEGKDLHKINAGFKNFPYTNSYDKYHPHCTIAYLKPNMADKYIKIFNEFLDLKVDIKNVVYSKVDGTKKTYNIQ
jgi:2'-5' RNA ligase